MRRSFGRMRTRDVPNEKSNPQGVTSEEIRAMFQDFVRDRLPDLISAEVERRIAERAEKADQERMRGVVISGSTDADNSHTWKVGDPVKTTRDINAANAKRNSENKSVGPAKTLREINQRNAEYWKPPIDSLAELNRRNSYLPRRDE